MRRFSPFISAIIFSLLFVIAGLVHALKQHPPYAPQVNTEQHTNTALKGEEDAKTGSPKAAKLDEEHGGKHAEQREEEGTEFWPAIFGVRLKITDSLLALFTFGLLIFTAQLSRSTDKLWVAGEKQLKLAREALVADQRAWLIVKEFGGESFNFSELKDGAADAEIEVHIQIANVGRTPALNVELQMKMIGNWATEAIAVQEFAARIDTSDIVSGRMISAGGAIEEEEILFTSGNELYQYGAGGRIRPLIVGCITYQILQDTERRQTAFVYRIEKVRDSGPIRVSENLTVNDFEAVTGTGAFAT